MSFSLAISQSHGFDRDAGRATKKRAGELQASGLRVLRCVI